MRRGALLAALAAGVAIAGDPRPARADSGIVEMAFGLTYEFGGTNDLVALDGYMGLELGQPILGGFYLEPLVRMSFGLTGTMKAIGVVRANFVAQPGVYFSLGFGAGNAIPGSANPGTEAISYRTVELSFKKGGKRRFAIDLATYFGHTEGLGTAILVRTTFVWARGL